MTKPWTDADVVQSRRRMLIGVWIALAIWLAILCVGASLYAPAPGDKKNITVDWRRGLALFTFVGGFLGLWIWMATRQRVTRRLRDGLTIPDHGSDGVQAGQEQGSEDSQDHEQP